MSIFGGKYKRYQPEHFLNTGQVEPAERVIRMLEDHGFEVVSQEGSHIQLHNDEYGLRWTQPHSTSDTFYQKEAAKLCLAVQEKRRSKEIETLKDDHAVAVNAGKNILTVKENLPEDIETQDIDDLKDFILLRSKKWPQVGMIALKETVEPEIKRYISEIKKGESQLEEAINFGEKFYDTDHFIAEDDYLVVEYQESFFSAEYPPYTTQNQVNPVSFITDFYAEIDNTIEICKQAIVEYKRFGFIDEGTEENGDPFIELHFQNQITREEFRKRLDILPSGMVNMLDWIKAQDDMFEFRFGQSGDKEYFSRILHDNYGFTVNRPKDKKTKNNSIIITHPLHQDFELKMPDPSEIQTIIQLITDYENRDFDFATRAMDIFERREECQITIEKIINQLNDWASTPIPQDEHEKIMNDKLKRTIEVYKKNGEAKELTLEDGRKAIEINYGHPITGTVFKKQIDLNENGLCPHWDWVDMEDELYEFIFGHPDDSKYFSKLLKERFGFKTTVSGSAKQHGDTLIITHPYHPEFREEMPMPSLLRSNRKISEEFHRVGQNPDADISLNLKTRMECFNGISRVVTNLNDWIKQSQPLNNLVAQTISTVPNAKGDRIVKEVKPGEEFTIIFNNNSTRLHGIRINQGNISKGYELQNKHFQHKVTYIALYNPEDMDRLQINIDPQ